MIGRMLGLGSGVVHGVGQPREAPRRSESSASFGYSRECLRYEADVQVRKKVLKRGKLGRRRGSKR
jgi:hypothetical protein